MKKKKHIPAVANDTKGGKSNMSEMNPQKPDSMKPIFQNLKDHHAHIREEK